MIRTVNSEVQTLRAETSAPHQVFEQRRQLFGEKSKIVEGRSDLDVVSGETVLPKLIHGLDVLLLVFHMSCNTEKTLCATVWSTSENRRQGSDDDPE